MAKSIRSWWGNLRGTAPATRNAEKKSKDNVFIELHEQLMAEVASLNLKPAQQKKWDELAKGVSKDKPLDASQVYKLEMFVLDHLDMVQLRMRMVALREIVHGILTKDALAMTAAALNGKRRGLGTARSEAKALATRVYRRYVLVPAVEERRSAVVVKLMRILLMIWLCAWFAHIILNIHSWREVMPSFHLAVIVAGATAATLSVIRRLYQIDPRHEPLLTWLSIEHGALSLYISPLVGAVFGVVLLLIAQSGLLTGALLPEFNCNPSAGAGRCAGLFLYAKVALLGLLAGWGERMVPDVLNKLAMRAEIPSEKT